MIQLELIKNYFPGEMRHNATFLKYMQLLRCNVPLAQSPPDYLFLNERHGIHNLQELKKAAAETINSVDLNNKKRDFEHLLFNKKTANEYFTQVIFFAN